MVKKQGEERREQARKDVELDIDLSTYEKYYLSKMENVSIGGAFVRTKDLQPVGTEIKMKFILPGDAAPIEAVGTVVWTYKQPGNREPNSTGMGIQFKNINEEDRERIASFISKTK